MLPIVLVIKIAQVQKKRQLPCLVGSISGLPATSSFGSFGDGDFLQDERPVGF